MTQFSWSNEASNADDEPLLTPRTIIKTFIQETGLKTAAQLRKSSTSGETNTHKKKEKIDNSLPIPPAARPRIQNAAISRSGD